MRPSPGTKGHRRPAIAHARRDIPEREPMVVSAKTLWVVLHATEVNGPQIQVPKAVAGRIGLRADLPKPGNGLVFLDRGPGVLQLVAMADPSVGATLESIRGLLAVATPTKKLVFSLPKLVRLHLRLGSRDIVAWVAPEGDSRSGSVFLVRSAFPDLIRPREAQSRSRRQRQWA